MGIGLGQFKQAGQQMATSERLAAEYTKQRRKAKKRRGWSGLLGGIGGKLIGGALAGLSGGLLSPLLMAGGMFAGKKLAHEATRGMAADTKGLKGDEYGYGKGEAKTLAEGLRSQMATDPMKEHGGFGQDVLASYLSAGLEGDMFKKAGDFGKDLRGLPSDVKEYGLGDTMSRYFGIGGEKFGEGVTKQGLADNPWLAEGHDFWGEFPDTYTPDRTMLDISGNPISEEPFKEGGQVPKYYGGGSVQGGNAAPTISEYFNMQGKSLGGSNKQSLAEMLGRK